MVTLIDVTTPAELVTLRTLFEEYAASLDFELCFQNFTEELASLPGEYAVPYGRLLIAKFDGEIAGCGALRPLTLPVICEMKRMYVRPQFRGYGIGRIIAHRIVNEARKIGYQKMRLDTVPKMTEAITLYRSLGFTEIAPYRENPIEGALYMELDFQKLQ